ncbi:unnamed protein product [Nippostrongylus brasiliensis]|uniref:Transposase n=1 Tax=Nippostrongylus brasiliensis TaxID=27835 RepID=A0A0N4XW75_NIPBR|nr:unnamed protein product [Nippostrongylus brasiliensis]
MCGDGSGEVDVVVVVDRVKDQFPAMHNQIDGIDTHSRIIGAEIRPLCLAGRNKRSQLVVNERQAADRHRPLRPPLAKCRRPDSCLTKPLLTLRYTTIIRR